MPKIKIDALDDDRAELVRLQTAHTEAYEAERDAKRRCVSGYAYTVLLRARDAAWVAFRDALRAAYPDTADASPVFGTWELVEPGGEIERLAA